MTSRAARSAVEPSAGGHAVPESDVATAFGGPVSARPAAVALFLLVLRFSWNLPRNLLILTLKAYRRIISPLYGPVCRFFPSCSAYALEAVTVHGVVKGSWLAARRLFRCHPWNAGGIDHVPAGQHHDQDPARVPYIIQLNHPEKFLADTSDTEGRSAA